MIALAAYGLLAGITLLCSWLVFIAWKRTGDFSVLFGAFILYAWTFLGAWFFIGDAATGFHGHVIGLNYYYLMQRMFPFLLNGNYLRALAEYGLFAGVVFGTLVLLTRRLEATSSEPVQVSRDVLLVIGVGSLAVSFFAVLPTVREAIAHRVSVYNMLHELTGWRSIAHGFADKTASVAALLATALVTVRNRSNAPLADRASFAPVWAPWALLCMVCTWFALIGNRHSLFTAFILVMVYMFNLGLRQVLRPVLAIGTVCLLALLAGGSVRGLAWSDQGLQAAVVDNEPFHLPAIAHVPRHPTTTLGRAGEKILSNEFFCAHMSLFGVHQLDVPVQPGIGPRYLFWSMVPGAVRPSSSYEYYAQRAHLATDQGFTIHHATAWYLSGGLPGIVIGSVLLGALWAFLLRLRRKKSSGWWGTLFGAVLPCAFVAFLPEFIRNGPEAYKSLLVEGLALPLVAVLVASWPYRRLRTSRHA